MVAAVAVALLAMRAGVAQSSAAGSEAPAAAGKAEAPKTPWGEPDLQGIWSRDVEIPLERPAKYANQEFFTDAERAELDRQIAGILSRDSTEAAGRRAPSGTSTANSARHPSPCTCPSAGGLHSSSIRRTAEYLRSRRRLRRPGMPCDNSSSRCCNQLSPARRNIPAAPAESTDPCHRDETRRRRCT